MDIFTRQAVQVFENKGMRLDANETVFLERELTQLRQKSLDVLYGEMLGRTLVPKATDVAASATTWAAKVYDRAGQAKIGGDDTDDPPRIDTNAKEILGHVYPVIASYGWGLNEMREAIRTRVPLSEKKALNCREAIELGIDDMLFQGFPEPDGGASAVIKTFGLSNNPDVEAAGIVALTDWTGATPVADIQAEIFSLLTAIRNRSLQRFKGTSLVLPLDRYDLIAQTPVGVDNQMTILQSILANNPFVSEIVPWYKLDGTGGNANGRAVCFEKNPLVLEGIIPQEFEQLPPQARNYEFEVPCHARCGGVKVYHPTGAVYGDFA